jgi:glucose/arabinose dehydrogenase
MKNPFCDLIRPLVASLLLAGPVIAFAQRGDLSRVYPAFTPRPALVMPNAAQQAALNAMTTAVQGKVQAAAAARAAVLEASLSAPATVTEKVNALAAAELDLALARADETVRIQASPARLSALQVRQLPALTAAQAVPAAAGRGAVATQDYPADPMEVIQYLPGFKAEIVARANRAVQGSWISLTEDSQGRLILGANEQQPFTRLTLDASGKVTKNETIATTVSEAMGSEWINGSLYVGGGRGDDIVYTKSNPTFCCEAGDMGIQRLSDPAEDGSFSKIETLLWLDGTEGGHSDHGVHDIVPAPDGKSLYMINGNMVYWPEQVSPDSPVRFSADDRVVPTLGTANRTTPGQARVSPADAAKAGRYGLGGWIAKMDFNGRNASIFATGLRNPLHFAFNGDGEIFTYDSDHEPEVGVPWYTPTRLMWIPSAANFGHRPGGDTGKYPEWYEDATPPLYNIGLGSPVGVTFGYNTRFPADYQKALFVADNNYGRIMAVHLKPLGSGYTVTSMEYFAQPKSLFTNAPTTAHNVTDLLVAKDGSFYYVIGNRATQSYLIRVTYTGNQPTAKVNYANVDGAADRKVRHDLEAFHTTHDDPKAVVAAWPQLGSEDRPIRYAARVALETVAPAAWKARALAETDAATSLGALLALARVGGKDTAEDLYTALARFPLTALPDNLKIRKLRIYEVAISRNGKPSDAAGARIIADVESIFPGPTFELNTESSQLLAYFNVPSAVTKTMTVIARSRIYQENFAYRYNIRNVTAGWTPELRKSYFKWFNDDHSNDNFLYNYREWFERVNRRPALAGNAGPMGQVRTAALANLTAEEKADAELSAILAAFPAGGGGRGGAGFFGP